MAAGEKMLIIKSEYSPSAAAELQENDNINALQMALLHAGMSRDDIDEYNQATESAARLYEEALQKSIEDDDDKWLLAVEASKQGLSEASDILTKHGISIENRIHEPITDDHFPYISTTIYNGFDEKNTVLRIERAVVDIEAKTYKDNKTGFGVFSSEN